MHEITILSGKGGTGKTTITAALASLAQPAVICDNDVDAADLFLILNPTIKKKGTFFSGWTAQISQDKCNSCGLCLSYCKFDAISINENGQYNIKPLSCEGCRLCERICPQQAITSYRNECNEWYESNTRFGPFVHAQMEPGEENSGKLVTFIRTKAKDLSKINPTAFILNDGPPGIGCPVIASLSGTNMVIVVVEPSLSGWHDAERVIELTKNFKIPVYCIINKSGINSELELEITKKLSFQNIKILGHIPYDRIFLQATMEKKNILEYAPESEAAEMIHSIWNNLLIYEPSLSSDLSNNYKLIQQHHE